MFTSSLDKAFWYTDRIRSGTVVINDSTDFWETFQPFGGAAGTDTGWGRGTIDDYFTLNGVPLTVAGEGQHDVIYSVVPVDPELLRTGANRIELLSDTHHHGIEVLLPGPALVVRFR